MEGQLCTHRMCKHTQKGAREVKAHNWGQRPGPQEEGSQSRGLKVRGTDKQSLRGCGVCRDTGTGVKSLRRPWNRAGTAERRRPWPGRQAGRAFCQALAALSCFLLPPQPGKSWGAYGFCCSSFGFQDPWHPWGLVSKGWSLPTPPGTEPCPQV